MKKTLIAVLVLAAGCTDSVTRPAASCDEERAAVEAAKAENRRATEWYTRAYENGERAEEVNKAWAAVEDAAAKRRKAQDTLDKCRTR